MSLLAWYGTDILSAPAWNIILNLPLLLFGWFKVSRRFVWYSLYGTVATSAWGALLDKLRVPVENDFWQASWWERESASCSVPRAPAADWTWSASI